MFNFSYGLADKLMLWFSNVEFATPIHSVNKRSETKLVELSNGSRCRVNRRHAPRSRYQPHIGVKQMAREAARRAAKAGA